MNVYEKLSIVQSKLRAPKGQYNSFGKYSYRSCEDIQEAVKPLLQEANALLVVSDEMIQLGDRYYIKATATFYDCEKSDCIKNTAYAREELDKKGMDASQITGSTSSYARKYALNGLFCIDDIKDADTQEPKEDKKKAPETQIEYKCEKCSTPFKEFDYNGKHYTAKDGFEISKKKNNGHAMCNKCKKEVNP